MLCPHSVQYTLCVHLLFRLCYTGLPQQIGLHLPLQVSIVIEQLFRLLHHCGMPRTDADLVHGSGMTMNEIMLRAQPRSTLFTGSQRVAEKLAADMKGKVYLEDAGFDWKILGPDVTDMDYVAWQTDQDAYACSGQKCSAQSIMFMHSNWKKAGLLDKLKALASTRQLSDLTIGPVLTWTTSAMLEHINKLLDVPGAKLLWGGQPLTGHNIPECYGAIQPTAVFVPLKAMKDPQVFELVTTEVFGPFYVVTEYDGELWGGLGGVPPTRKEELAPDLQQECSASGTHPTCALAASPCC
eukprot:GHUV01055463.1.p1 GENE.GHUV01055463.1~~GHUV01055463.1.p1  ORF type:complete len:297 (+),score=65.10 GHUV01055463.1:357-1247(+)